MIVNRDIAGAVLCIDLNAIVDNYRLLQARVAPTRLAAVVKADGYGLGATQVAAALAGAGCGTFFVAHLAEAEALRAGLPRKASIFILNGVQPGAEGACVESGAIPVLNSLDQVYRWSQHACAVGTPLPAALQADSGMSRLGLAASEIETLVAQPERLRGIDLRLIMSHLACADEPGSPANDAQHAAFRVMADRFPGLPRSLDNSGGAFHDRLDHLDLVRAGIALYGGAVEAGAATPMQPVVSLSAQIIQVHAVPAGTGIGYGLTHRTEGPRLIATLSLGYADGWPRRLGNRGSAYIGGVRVPIVGRISMDSLTLDVTGVPNPLLYSGAPVEMIGPHQTIDEVAADADTIAYEILTQLGRRFARDYLPVRAAAAQRSPCP